MYKVTMALWTGRKSAHNYVSLDDATRKVEALKSLPSADVIKILHDGEVIQYLARSPDGTWGEL